jgi:prefoldin subunit 5
MIDKQPPKTYISNPTEPNHHRYTEFTRNLGFSSLAINQINSQSESIFKSIDNLTNKINSLEPTILEIKSCIDWFKNPLTKRIFGIVLAILMLTGAWFWFTSVTKPIARLEESIARLEEGDKDINKTLNSINDQLSFLKGSFELVSKNKARAAETN